MEAEKYRDSKKHNDYKNTYTKENYDRFSLFMKAGKKQMITEMLSKSGYKSLNEFINAAIDEKLASMGVTLE